MMDFNTFRHVVKDNIREYMGEEYKDYCVTDVYANKINEFNKPGISITPNESSKIKPTFYFEDLYWKYNNVHYGDIDSFMKEFADNAKSVLSESSIALDYLDEGFTDTRRIMPVLVNKESNKELLETCPHRDVGDMAVIYKYIIQNKPEGSASLNITNGMLNEYLKVSEEELFVVANDNLKTYFNTKITNMSDMLIEMAVKDGMPREIAASFFPETPGMYVCLNENLQFAASAMLNDDIMNEAKVKIGGDFYILPSSIHECILVDKEMADNFGMGVDDLRNVVTEINANGVSEKERLSNNIYKYDFDKKQIMQVSNSPNIGIKDMDYKDPERNITI